MVLKNLNDISIYIVPLCDDNITWRDLTVESGFINAYTTDKNRPFLEDMVFLVYDSSVNTVESLERFRKFCQLKTKHSTKYITINKKHYTVYCFNNPKYKKDIINLRETGKVINLDAALCIQSFWNGVSVPELVQRLFITLYRFGEPMKAEVPEEDYYSYEDIGESS